MSMCRHNVRFLLNGVVLLFLVSAEPLSARETTDDLRKKIREDMPFVEVPADQMDLRAITPTGRRCLTAGLVEWKHAQTDHFVVHYERRDFARHVARLAEFLYQYMATELNAGEDRLTGRSHIFIFNTARRWKAFSEVMDSPGEWAFSFVRGPDMFLQRAGARHESGDIVAHEMVHIILYRFYGKDPPLWLNEGLAQWYQEFAYSAFKGAWRSRRAPFTPIKSWYPLQDLILLKEYPADAGELVLFYKTAKYLVGYLMLEYPPRQMYEFVARVTEGMPAERALCEIYRIGEINYLENAFERFAR